jgi:hypothetical protein
MTVGMVVESGRFVSGIGVKIEELGGFVDKGLVVLLPKEVMMIDQCTFTSYGFESVLRKALVYSFDGQVLEFRGDTVEGKWRLTVWFLRH